MPSELPFDVAVIGAGASGALLAAQFARTAPDGGRLALIGAGNRVARGLAYETVYKANLLNVMAGNMSAFPDDREHFARWLASRLPNADAKTFAPRRLYGDYLAEILAESLRVSSVVPINGSAINLTRSDGLWSVQLEHGATVRAQSVVLAFGNLPPAHDPLDVSQISEFYHRSPWSPDALLGLPAEAPVLLIGSGLTMVDVSLSLREAGHRGPIQAVSRHGRLSQFHQPYNPHPLADLPAAFHTPFRAMRWIRAEVESVQHAGGDWRAVIDSLRPHTANIWHGWTLAQRATFLRHARSLWDIHRHRMAPEIADQLADMVTQGTLSIHAGRITGAERDGHMAKISLRSATTGESFSLWAARVINCTGPERDYARARSPLVASIRAQGWLSPDPLRLGIETDIDGRLIGSDGSPVPGLFSLGPPRMPALWESIAIPEIRLQAAGLARLLISESVGARLAQTEPPY